MSPSAAPARELLRDVDDRAACWDETIVCASERWGDARVFAREGVRWEIGTPVRWRRWRDDPSRARERLRGDGFGFDECLCDVSEEEYRRFRRDGPSAWTEFARWMAGDDGAGVDGG